MLSWQAWGRNSHNSGEENPGPASVARATSLASTHTTNHPHGATVAKLRESTSTTEPRALAASRSFFSKPLGCAATGHGSCGM